MQMLTKQETAKRLRIHPESLMRMVRYGQFPAPIRVGAGLHARVRFDEADVERWLEVKKADASA